MLLFLSFLSQGHVLQNPPTLFSATSFCVCWLLSVISWVPLAQTFLFFRNLYNGRMLLSDHRNFMLKTNLAPSVKRELLQKTICCKEEYFIVRFSHNNYSYQWYSKNFRMFWQFWVSKRFLLQKKTRRLATTGIFSALQLC